MPKTMTAKTLIVDPIKCNGCGDCKTACAEKHTGEKDPARSRIQLINHDIEDGFYLPMTCQQCDDPPCLAVCPHEAIYRDDDLNRVMIDRNRCIGCKMCVSACPFGAMGFDEDRGRAYKCDLCGGDPACVASCDRKALTFGESFQLHLPQMRDIAGKLCGVMGRKAA